MGNDIHLLFPLISSVFLVIGLLFVKRVTSNGVSAWTAAFLSNQCAAVLLAPLLLADPSRIPTELVWQPILVSLMYIAGQSLVFLAIEHGDVSVATPVFSLKVLLVAVFLWLLFDTAIPGMVWGAACLAVFGVVLVQYSDGAVAPAHMLRTVAIALASAMSFSLCDVFVQHFGANWDAQEFLPLVFLSAACFSVGMLPWVDRPARVSRELRWPLLVGSFLVALNASVLVFTLSTFGDAARVNIVYAIRGPMGVVMAWMLAAKMKTSEGKLSSKVLTVRLLGASLVVLAVSLVLIAD